jgi:hypothetical protein
MANRTASIHRVCAPFTKRLAIDLRGGERFWVSSGDGSTYAERLEYQGVVRVSVVNGLTTEKSYGNISMQYEIELFNPCLATVGSALRTDSKQRVSSPATNFASAEEDSVKEGKQYLSKVFDHLKDQAVRYGVRSLFNIAKLPLPELSDVSSFLVSPGAALKGKLDLWTKQYFAGAAATGCPTDTLPKAGASYGSFLDATNYVEGGLYLVSWYEGAWRQWSVPVHISDSSVYIPDGEDYGALQVSFDGAFSALTKYHSACYVAGTTNDMAYITCSLVVNIRNLTDKPCYVYWSNWTPTSTRPEGAGYYYRADFVEGDFTGGRQLLLTKTADADEEVLRLQHLSSLLGKGPRESESVQVDAGPAFDTSKTLRRRSGD